MAASETVYLYHHTHIDNLSGIIHRGLLCKALVKNVNVDASLASIQTRRQRKLVTCEPGGVLHDYVPFYFGYRSPMMFLISKGEVPNYKGAQDEMIYLVTSVQNVVGTEVSFVFTDGHPIKFPSKFYNSPEDLGQLDWNVIKGKWWNDTPQYPDRERRRQAEFLVYQHCPWNLINYIGVANGKRKSQVEDVLKPATHTPMVLLRRHWYY